MSNLLLETYPHPKHDIDLRTPSRLEQLVYMTDHHEQQNNEALR